VGEASGKQTAPVWDLGCGRGGPRRLADSCTEPGAGVGVGGCAPVRKRAPVRAVQLLCEVGKVVGRLV
jgi:hypothetical protein